MSTKQTKVFWVKIFHSAFLVLLDGMIGWNMTKQINLITILSSLRCCCRMLTSRKIDNHDEALQTEYLNWNVPHSKGIKIQGNPQGPSLRHIKHNRIYILPCPSRKSYHLKRKCDECWKIFTQWPPCFAGVQAFFFWFIEIVIWYIPKIFTPKGVIYGVCC